MDITNGTQNAYPLDSNTLPNSINNVCNVKPSDYTTAKSLQCSCKIASEGSASDYQKAIDIASAHVCSNPEGSTRNEVTGYYECTPGSANQYCLGVNDDNVTYKCETDTTENSGAGGNLIPI